MRVYNNETEYYNIILTKSVARYSSTVIVASALKSISGNTDSAAFARLNTSVSNVLPLRLLFAPLFPPVCGLIFRKTLKEVHWNERLISKLSWIII